MRTTINHTEYFKRLALGRLKQEHKSHTIYPIYGEDLLCFKSCPLCKTSKLEIIAEVYLNKKLNFLTTAICTNCLFIFRSVSPKFSWFKKCWAAIRSDKIEVFNPKAEKYKQKRYEIYRKLISPYILRGKLLDIGASYGTGSNIFKQTGFTVSAIEAEENKINYLKKELKIPVVATSIEHSFKQLKHKYDVVIFSNCLEHLDFPVPVISKMGGLLKSDGIMLLAIPYLWNSVNWSDALYLTHKSNFTIENIFELLIKNNFEILEVISIPYFQETALIIRKRPHGMKPAFKYTKQRFTINKVKKLYRKDLPIKKSLPINKVIKYTVPYIDQFFQTINLGKNTIKWEDGYITFVSNKHISTPLS
jgi:2-polyprenyl-3-methyl-5-hydroxy-6-metoxy-1,4-benzoquinol methylase